MLEECSAEEQPGDGEEDGHQHVHARGLLAQDAQLLLLLLGFVVLLLLLGLPRALPPLHRALLQHLIVLLLFLSGTFAANRR